MSALSEALNEANVEGWSAREIARRSGFKVSHSVVADYLGGRQAKRPKEYVLAAFVDVFPSLTISRLRELAGLSAGEDQPWRPPDEVHQLSGRQQKALTELIRAIAADQGRGEGDDDVEVPTIERELTAREKLQQVPGKAAKSKPRTDQ